MILNALFWERYFQAEFVSQIKAVVDVLEKRILAGFANIEEESERVSKETWEMFMSMLAAGDEDPADFVEVAERAGVAHYLLFDGIRQGILNLIAAALYHAFEQQIMLFHRKEILKRAEENDHALCTLSEFQRRLAHSGIDIQTFASRAKIEELRLVANTVKLAEGDSAQRLRRLRPDMFQNPRVDRFVFSGDGNRQVFQPLIGEDLHVSLEDIHDYSTALIVFWEELSDAMCCA